MRNVSNPFTQPRSKGIFGMKRATEDTFGSSLAKKTVIVGMGNDMRGDDGFGPIVARRLQGRLRADVIDAGTAPENYLGRIAALEPETVLIVDAVDFDGQPGDIVLLEPNELVTTSFSTHMPSLALLESYLSAEQDVCVLVLAAQPSTTEPGATLSDEMVRAIERTVRLLEKVVGGATGTNR